MVILNKNRFFWLSLVTFVLVAQYVSFNRPLPPLEASVKAHALPATRPVQIPWPSYGQAAVGAVGYGVLATNRTDSPAPTASTAKVITALTLLSKKPLAAGQQGPTLVLDEDDVALFEKYYAMGGAVVPVAVGERITQYQALQALMLPSANNIAEALVIWAFGSVDNYLKEANAYVKKLGMDSTVVADPTGFSPQTVSTARDLVILGQAAMENPALANIVSQRQAVIPVAGTITNLNWLLGEEGVVGIKTGTTDEAGGCFIVAAKRTIQGQEITLVGAVMGANILRTAITDSEAIVKALDSGFEKRKVIAKGQELGFVPVPWEDGVRAVAKDDVSLFVWRGSEIKAKTELDLKQVPLDKNAEIGSVRVTDGQQTISTAAVLEEPITEPSWHWRLLH